MSKEIGNSGIGNFVKDILPKKKKAKSLTSLLPPIAALVLIAVGLIGLTVANTAKKLQKTNQQVTESSLKVQDADESFPQANRSTSGTTLQNAARTQDLMKDKPANSVQKGSSIPQGTNIDELLEHKEIQ